MIGGSATTGENSNDECCMCEGDWSEGQQGWVLCDTQGCENTVCAQCTSILSLSVSELFYCPICAGSGQSAAAAVGGAVATAVAACTELEKLPVSFKTTQKILTNLLNHPDEAKYRKLRLENKSVKQLVDLWPVLNILTSVGFARTQCARQTKNNHVHLPPKEEVLLLEGPVPATQVNDLLQIMNGLSQEVNDACDEKKGGKDDDSPTTETDAKRKPYAESDEQRSNKKQKGDEGN